MGGFPVQAGFCVILDKDHESEKWSRADSECSFALCGAEIHAAAERFLATIVGVVAIRWTAQRLQFDGGEQPAFINRHDIPLFGWAEVAGQNHELFEQVDFQIRRSDFLDLTGDQGGESIQILARGRSTTVSLFDRALWLPSLQSLCAGCPKSNGRLCRQVFDRWSGPKFSLVGGLNCAGDGFREFGQLVQAISLQCGAGCEFEILGVERMAERVGQFG